MSGHPHTETLRALVSCDGAPVPIEWRSDGRKEVPVRAFGPEPELTLRATELGQIILEKLVRRADDLVHIAAYVHAADLQFSRGGDRDPHRRRWRRDIAMVVPVFEPEFWNRLDVTAALADTLGFVTEDTWSFAFTEARTRTEQLRFEVMMDERVRSADPDTVVLFSDGTDSLCTLIEAVTTDARPLAVGHRSTPNINAVQRRLLDELKTRFPSWPFPYTSFYAKRHLTEATERTRRSRGFLFASFGAAVAGQLGIPRVLLADNGYVSVNPPING